MSDKVRKLKLGVLVSGGGSNLQAIIDASEAGKLDAEVLVVISDTPDVKALERASNHKIPSRCIQRNDFGSKDEFEQAILDELKRHEVELVCLAGFMRIIGPTLLEPYRGSMINIHPALLPSFPGLEAQRQAWDYGVKVSGCTVHFVDDLTDHGPIIAQTAVTVEEGDTWETLRDRILVEEHKLFPYAIQMIAEDRIGIEGRSVIIRGKR